MGWRECGSPSCSSPCLQGSVIFSCSPYLMLLARLWLFSLPFPGVNLFSLYYLQIRGGRTRCFGTGDHSAMASSCCSPHRVFGWVFFLAIFNLHRQLQGDETPRGNTNLKFPVASVPGQVGRCSWLCRDAPMEAGQHLDIAPSCTLCAGRHTEPPAPS